MLQRFGVAARYSDAAVFNGVVYLAGQVADKTIDHGITEQTTEILATIDHLLTQAGSGKDRILMCQIFLADIKDFAAMNAVWDKWVVAGNTPPRATVQAPLASPKYRVEMVVTAAQSA